MMLCLSTGGGMWRTVLCSNWGVPAEGGNGGSSPFAVMEEEYDAPDTTLLAGERGGSSCCGEVFSHVRGGPEARTEFWDRPIVFGRPPCLTVPKSHKSSRSPFSCLFGTNINRRDTKNRKGDLRIRVNVVFVLFVPSSPFCPPSFVSFNEFGKVTRFLGHSNKFVFQKFLCRRSLQNDTINCKILHLAVELTSRGSRCRQYETNSRKGFEKFPSSVGGGFFGIKKRTWKWWCHCTGMVEQRYELTFIGCSSAYGGSPLANSMAVMPKLQISALWS